MARVHKLVAVFGLLALGAACSKSDDASPQKVLRAQSADADLDALFAASAGTVSTDATKAEQILESALTTDELAHLRNIDWMALTGAGVLADSTLLKAMGALEEAGAVDPSVTPSSRGLHISATYSCDADCIECQQALDRAINALHAKLAVHAVGGAFVCVAFAGTGFGAVILGALVLNLVARDAQNLVDLTACKIGNGGTLTQGFGAVSRAIAAANQACICETPCGDGAGGNGWCCGRGERCYKQGQCAASATGGGSASAASIDACYRACKTDSSCDPVANPPVCKNAEAAGTMRFWCEGDCSSTSSDAKIKGPAYCDDKPYRCDARATAVCCGSGTFEYGCSAKAACLAACLGTAPCGGGTIAARVKP